MHTIGPGGLQFMGGCKPEALNLTLLQAADSMPLQPHANKH